MATLGNNTTTSTASGKSPGDLHVFGPYTAASSGSPITQISMLLDGLNSITVDQHYALVVYADNGSTPVGGALVAQTAAQTITHGTAKAYVNVSLSAGSITSGNKYWVGIFVASTDASGDANIYYDNPGATPVAQCLASPVTWNSGTAPATFPTASFGPASTITVGAYLTYTVAAAVTGNTASSSRAQNVLLVNDML